jgi:hypothetical protein
VVFWRVADSRYALGIGLGTHLTGLCRGLQGLAHDELCLGGVHYAGLETGCHWTPRARVGAPCGPLFPVAISACLVLLIIPFIRPYGLFGKPEIERV